MMVGGIDKDNKMKVKNIIFCLTAAPLFAYANINNIEQDLKGFHIEFTENNSLKSDDEYINTEEQNKYINYFFNLPKVAYDEKKYFSSTSNKTDTHLKSTLSEIKLSVPYKEPEILKDKIFSYAPIGSYSENGWSGIRSFFQDELLGTCSYSFEKYIYVKAENSYIKNIVNARPSFSSIEGNYNAGFLYTLSWDIDHKDFVYDHKIECANIKLNKLIMKEMINLANIIDNNDRK